MTTVVLSRSARSVGHARNGSLPAVDELRLQRLLDVGRSLVAVLDPRPCSQRLLEVARELTGARYAAIGVLDALARGRRALRDRRHRRGDAAARSATRRAGAACSAC